MKLVNLQKCGCFKNWILLKRYQATNLLGDNIYCTVYLPGMEIQSMSNDSCDCWFWFVKGHEAYRWITEELPLCLSTESVSQEGYNVDSIGICIIIAWTISYGNFEFNFCAKKKLRTDFWGSLSESKEKSELNKSLTAKATNTVYFSTHFTKLHLLYQFSRELGQMMNYSICYLLKLIFKKQHIGFFNDSKMTAKMFFLHSGSSTLHFYKKKKKWNNTCKGLV